jgi:predicted HTH domain antitoxin
MKTVTLQVPDNVDAKEAHTLLAAKLYENGFLSLGQAAELAGYSKRTFMGLLANYQVSVFNYTETELDKEILPAQSYHL